MTTSGSTDFSINALDIVSEGYDACGILDPNETLSPDMTASGLKKLNIMVKAWMAQGMNLWAMSEATLFLSLNTQTYSLGGTGDHCTNSYVHTTLSTNEALGSTSLGLTSATGMSASDKIGIVLDSGVIHWTTISGSPGATTTISLGLASAASAGNVVFAYTTKINRPLRIISAYRRSISNQDTPIEVTGRKIYSELANKFTTGKIVQAYYDPQLTLGKISVWPTNDLATDVLRFWYERPIEDFDSEIDTPDFPIEWSEALINNLAYRLTKPNNVPKDKRLEIKADADQSLLIASAFGQEDSSVYFQPDLH